MILGLSIHFVFLFTVAGHWSSWKGNWIKLWRRPILHGSEFILIVMHVVILYGFMIEPEMQKLPARLNQLQCCFASCFPFCVV